MTGLLASSPGLLDAVGAEFIENPALYVVIFLVAMIAGAVVSR